MKNEITIKLKCNIKEIKEILVDKGFQLTDKFEIKDAYYISNEMDMKSLMPRDILKSYVLIRCVKQYNPNNFDTYYNIEKIVYKRKNIDSNGNIINQEKYDCEIKNIDEGKSLLKAMNYKEIMSISEKDEVYGRKGINIAIKDIINGDNLIEVECNNKFDTIEKLKSKIIELDLPIDQTNFFVNKAEIKLKEILKN